MKLFVDKHAGANGQGTKEAPFLTIQEASDVAVAGDEIIVAAGEYHEDVHPVHAGCKEAPIVYRAEVPGTVVITGAERPDAWVPYAENVWMAKISNEIFGEYNPYTTIIKGDWYSEEKHIHTGEIYLNGKSLYEAEAMEDVLHPTVYGGSWDPEFTVYKWFTWQEEDQTILIANFQGLDPNEEEVLINVRRRCFFPLTEGIDYITLQGFHFTKAATQWAPPTAFQDGMVGPNWAKGWVIENCEVSHSKCSGISLGKYLQKENDNKWSKYGWKDGTQTERDAICQAQREGWTKENIGHHVVRGCHIHHCGQTGIVGHLGGVFSVIEENHIHNINNKQDLAGAEIGGIKMHAAIDCIYRHNHIHHCTRGLWLDWQAQGTRVTENIFHDNTPPKGTKFGFDVLTVGEDIFVEVSHGPTLIDHNLLLSKAALRLPTQGCAIVHNFIAGSFTCVGAGVNNGGVLLPTPRYTPYHVPHETAVAGFMTILHGDMRFVGNVFAQQQIRPDLQAFALQKSYGEIQYQCGTIPYTLYPTKEEYEARFAKVTPLTGNDRDRYYDHLPVEYRNNIYFNGALPCLKETDALVDVEHKVRWWLGKTEEADFVSVEENSARYDLFDGMTFITNYKEYLPEETFQILTTDDLGEAFEPEQKFENPDGSKIVFGQDLAGCVREDKAVAGPFA